MAEEKTTKKSTAKTKTSESKETKGTKQTKAKATETAAEQKEEKIVPKDIDLSMLIPVKNGTLGRLVYISKRTGEKFEWDEFGEEQDMELRELRTAKASKGFFINNLFLFDEEYDWVIDFLGMRKFYKDAVTVDGFDELFEKTPAEIKKAIAKLSNGQKATVLYRARQMITDGEIDSIKVIKALETALGTELIES